MTGNTRTEKLTFPDASRAFLENYLPQQQVATQNELPLVTLTYACSLDSRIAAAPGVRTRLSGHDSKAMTHFLRSRHDAILVGRGTARADNPSLNCRIEGVDMESQPRPIILDGSSRWEVDGSAVLDLAQRGEGKAPFIVWERRPPNADREGRLEAAGGKYIQAQRDFPGDDNRWSRTLRALYKEGIRSVMIEGGADVINSLLLPRNRGFVTTVIVTYAPVWLGREGLQVAPALGKEDEQLRVSDLAWLQCARDMVLCGRINGERSKK